MSIFGNVSQVVRASRYGRAGLATTVRCSRRQRALAGLVIGGLGWAITGIAIPARAVAATTSGANVVAVPPSMANCAVDVSQSLNAFIASVPDGSTIEFASNGCYRVDRTILVANRTGLDFEGNGSTFRRLAPTPAFLLAPGLSQFNAHWTFRQSTNITVRNMHVMGLDLASCGDAWTYEPLGFGCGDSAHAFEQGFGFFGVTGLVVDNVSAYAVWGDGLTLGGEDSASAVRNATVTNVMVDRNGRQGVAVVSADHLLLDNIQILHSIRTGFDLEPNGATAFVHNVEIRNSYVNCRTVSFAAEGGQDISNINVHNNTVRGQDPSWQWLAVAYGPVTPRTNWTVAHNTILVRIVSVSSLWFDNVDKVTVDSNVSPGNGANPAVLLTKGGGTNTITNNIFVGSRSAVSNILIRLGSVLVLNNRLI